MDILYHTVVGYAIGESMGGHELAGILGSTLPDLVGTAPFYYLKLKRISKTSIQSVSSGIWEMLTSNKFLNSFDRITYHTTHSFITAALITIISYLFFHPVWSVISVAYISHILIDIPTHEGDFATHFLYPLSHIHAAAKNWIKHPALFLTFWALLITVILLFDLT